MSWLPDRFSACKAIRYVVCSFTCVMEPFSWPWRITGTPTVPCSVHLQTYDDRKDGVSLQQGLIVPGPYGVRLPLPLKSEYAQAYVLFKVETSMSSRNSNAAMNISGVWSWLFSVVCNIPYIFILQTMQYCCRFNKTSELTRVFAWLDVTISSVTFIFFYFFSICYLCFYFFDIYGYTFLSLAVI